MSAYRITKMNEFLTHRNEFFQIDDFQEYKRVRIQLHGQGLVLRDIITGSKLSTKKQQAVQTGEFLVAEIDAKVGGFGIIPEELEGAIVSSHYFTFKIDGSVCLSEWLEYYVRSGFLTEQVAARGSTNYASIRAYHVLDFEIPLPSLAEQRRIVARIEALAGKVAEARRLREGAVVETENLWASYARKMLYSLDKVPWKPLSQLVEISGGSTPSKKNPAYWGGGIPWISPKDMKVQEIYDSIDHITEEALHGSRIRLHPPGSVLIVVRGMILAHTVPSAVLRAFATINQDIKALTSNGELMPEYLCTVLWAINMDLVGLIERSTHGTCKFLAIA